MIFLLFDFIKRCGLGIFRGIFRWLFVKPLPKPKPELDISEKNLRRHPNYEVFERHMPHLLHTLEGRERIAAALGLTLKTRGSRMKMA
jgi:hypothetical protein